MQAVDARQDGRPAAIPTAAERVWWVFWSLDTRRTSNGYAANAIPPSEIEAWCRLRGETLRRWELDALDKMEAARLRWLDGAAGGGRGADEPIVVRGQPLTPALMKALFG